MRLDFLSATGEGMTPEQKARAHNMFAFHRSKTLTAWLNDAPAATVLHSCSSTPMAANEPNATFLTCPACFCPA